MNAEGLSRAARLEVELVDELERPLPGYAASDAVPLEDSALNASVFWKGRTALPENEAFRIKARFEGEKRASIRLYAMYVGGR